MYSRDLRVVAFFFLPAPHLSACESSAFSLACCEYCYLDVCPLSPSALNSRLLMGYKRRLGRVTHRRLCTKLRIRGFLSVFLMGYQAPFSGSKFVEGRNGVVMFGRKRFNYCGCVCGISASLSNSRWARNIRRILICTCTMERGYHTTGRESVPTSV